MLAEDWFLPVALGGAVLSLACAFTAEAAGATVPRSGLVVVLLYGCFLAGWVAPGIAGAVMRWRTRARRQREQRQELAGLEVRVTAQRIAVRRPGSLLVLRWTAVRMADFRKGLLLLHADGGVLIGLPDRLLTLGQRNAVLERAEPLDDLF